MTAPTLKPEDGPPRGRFRIPRVAALALSACLAFAVFALALVRLLPAPRSRADYLVAGTLATLAALITVFAGLLLGRRKSN